MTVSAIRGSDFLDDFVVPPELEARGPAETRGLSRDQVRLMVSDGGRHRHVRFDQLPALLGPGDLLVVNDSATIPASVTSGDIVVNFSTKLPGGLQVAELRRSGDNGSTPWSGGHPRSLSMPGGLELELMTPFPAGSVSGRLWIVALHPVDDLFEYLAEWGEPIRYSHLDRRLPLADHQTIFARTPGSAEMPSAGRPFTHSLVTRLLMSGIAVARLTLHTGVSSLEAGEDPYPEWFVVPLETARLVNHVRAEGGRVIAVGTTVVRALESAADDRGGSHPSRGWTDLVVGPDHEMRVVDGLITGWHEPASTHLDMLEALMGRESLMGAHRDALGAGYLWHEFGDSHLILSQG